MKKIVFTIFILLFPVLAKAECTSLEISELKTLASKISVTYDYVEKNGSVVFSATFHNVNKNLKLKNNRNNKIIYTNNYGNEFYDVTISNINFGGTYSVDVLSNNRNCLNKTITTKYYDIPYYNFYHEHPLCEGREDKKICQKWLNTYSISYEQFKSEFEKKEEVVIEEEDLSKYNLIMDLFVKYYYIFFGIIIVGSLTAIIIINKKNSYDFDT